MTCREPGHGPWAARVPALDPYQDHRHTKDRLLRNDGEGSLHNGRVTWTFGESKGVGHSSVPEALRIESGSGTATIWKERERKN